MTVNLFGVFLRTNFGLSIHSLCLDLAGHPSYVTVVTVSYMGLRQCILRASMFLAQVAMFLNALFLGDLLSRGICTFVFTRFLRVSVWLAIPSLLLEGCFAGG